MAGTMATAATTITTGLREGGTMSLRWIRAKRAVCFPMLLLILLTLASCSKTQESSTCPSYIVREGDTCYYTWRDTAGNLQKTPLPTCPTGC